MCLLFSQNPERCAINVNNSVYFDCMFQVSVSQSNGIYIFLMITTISDTDVSNAQPIDQRFTLLSIRDLLNKQHNISQTVHTDTQMALPARSLANPYTRSRLTTDTFTVYSTDRLIASYTDSFQSEMPLPAALLKRLSQRGIVNDASKKPAPKERAAPAEEIIAEDYDDDDQEQPNNTEFDYQSAAQSKKPNFWSERLKRRIVDGNISAKGYRACPNKYNVHHKCAMFCINKYGDGIREPDEEYLRRKQRLLRKYPLPSEWQEVYDEGW